MSSRYLGETFDIHGGGKDLIFPHHENELAQSMAVSGKPLAHYWVHNGFVTIQGEKMSKSLGNFLTIQEMIRRFHPEAIRLLLLSHQYRSPLDYSDRAMQEAQMGLHRLYTLLEDLEHPENRLQMKGNQSLTPELVQESKDAVNRFKENFDGAMDDDFNTAQGIGHMYELARQLNRIMDTVRSKEIKGLADQFERVAGLFKQYGQILGILTMPPQAFLEQEQTRLLEKKGLSAEAIERLIAERNQARKDKDWVKADALRERLIEMNILLKDSPQGTIWQIEE